MGWICGTQRTTLGVGVVCWRYTNTSQERFRHKYMYTPLHKQDCADLRGLKLYPFFLSLHSHAPTPQFLSPPLPTIHWWVPFHELLVQLPEQTHVRGTLTLNKTGLSLVSHLCEFVLLHLQVLTGVSPMQWFLRRLQYSQLSTRFRGILISTTMHRDVRAAWICQLCMCKKPEQTIATQTNSQLT